MVEASLRAQHSLCSRAKLPATDVRCTAMLACAAATHGSKRVPWRCTRSKPDQFWRFSTLTWPHLKTSRDPSAMGVAMGLAALCRSSRGALEPNFPVCAGGVGQRQLSAREAANPKDQTLKSFPDADDTARQLGFQKGQTLNPSVPQSSLDASQLLLPDSFFGC